MHMLARIDFDILIRALYTAYIKDNPLNVDQDQPFLIFFFKFSWPTSKKVPFTYDPYGQTSSGSANANCFGSTAACCERQHSADSVEKVGSSRFLSTDSSA